MPRRDDAYADDLAPLDDFDEDIREPRERRSSLMMPLIITMMVMTGASMIAWYSYTAGVKEGSERAAPLLAPEGPVKVAPATPGGIEIPHREKTIYHALDGGRPDTKVERLLPLPEPPMTPPVAAPEVADASRVRAADSAPQGGSDVPAPGQPLQLAPAETAPVKPSEAPRVAQAPTVQPPAAKPEPQHSAQKPASESRPAPTETAALPAGAYRIQIGSVSTSEQAQRLWNIEVAKNEPLLGRLTMSVQKATIQGKDFFRVQGGPLRDRAEAENLCAQLKQRGVGCLVVNPSR